MFKSKMLILLLVITSSVQAFDPTREVVVTVHGGHLVLTVPAGAHLKQGGFKVVLASTPGRIKVGPLPPATDRDDAGDPIWRGTVLVPLTGEGLPDAADLRVTFRPCTEGEGGVCYLPQHRTIRIRSADLLPEAD